MRNKYFIVSIILLLAICSYLFYSFYKLEETRKINELITTQKIHAKQAARSFNESFDKWNSVLLYLSKDIDIIQLSEKGKKELSHVYEIHKDDINGVTRTNKFGTIIYTTPYYPNSIGTDISNQSHMIKILKDHKPVISDVFKAVQGYQAIVIHYPIFKDNKFDGTIALLLNFTNITKRIMDEIVIGQSGFAWMINHDGTEIYCHIKEHIGKSIFEVSSNNQELTNIAKRMLSGEEGAANYHFSYPDNANKIGNKLAYFIPVKINNSFWSLAITSFEEEMTESLIEYRNNLIMVILLIFAGGIFISYFGLKAWITIKETTARLEAEKNLLASEEKFKQLIQRLPQLVWITTPDGHCDFMNKRWVDFTGIPEIEQLGMGWLNQIHPDDKTELLNEWGKAVKSSSIFHMEFRIRRYDGVYHWFDTRAVPLLNLDGNIIKWFGSNTDIQEERNVREALRQSEEKYRLISTVTSDYMFSTQINSDGSLSHNWVAGAFENITEFPFDEYVSKGGWRAFLHPDDHEEDNRAMEKLNNNIAVMTEARTITKSGKVVWVRIYAHPVWDEKNNKLAGIFGAVQDINEQKTAEEALKQSEAKFSKAFNSSPNSISITKLSTGEILEINDGFQNIFGFTKEEVIGKTIFDLNLYVNTRDREYAINKLSTGEKIRDLILIARNKSGEKRICSFSFEIIDILNEQCLLTTVRDITEEKKVELTLRQNEELLSQVIKVSKIGIFDHDHINENIYWSPKLKEIFGLRADEKISLKMFEELLHPEDKDRVMDAVQKAHDPNGNGLFNVEHRIIRKDGIIRWLTAKSQTFFEGDDENRQPVRTVGAYLDVTEQQIVASELIKLNAATEQSPAAIVITDLEGKIEYINATFTKITGFELHEIEGKPLRILKGNKIKTHNSLDIWKKIKSGSEWRGEYFNKRKDGSNYWESTLISPIKDEQGNITHFLAIQEDITEKKRTFEELILAKEKAEEAIRVKNVFLANMSHELRTPLIGILGYSEMLAHELKQMEKREMALGIKRSGLRLLNTLNLILDLTKFESDKIDLNFKIVNLAAETQIVYDLFKGAALDKELKFVYITKQEKLNARIDERLFRIVLENLINNAIKFTDKGEIFVTTENEMDQFVVIKIKDTGIGIAKENHYLIFEEFRQVSEGINREYQGTGLGLSITKKYVEILGGTILLESEIGLGSTFTIRFPLVNN